MRQRPLGGDNGYIKQEIWVIEHLIPDYYKLFLLSQVVKICFLCTPNLIDGIGAKQKSNITLKTKRQFDQERIKSKTMKGSNGASTYAKKFNNIIASVIITQCANKKDYTFCQ